MHAVYDAGPLGFISHEARPLKRSLEEATHVRRHETLTLKECAIRGKEPHPKQWLAKVAFKAGHKRHGWPKARHLWWK